MSEAKCIECDKVSSACKCPTYAAEETRTQAHARGVTEERARWVGWCERVKNAPTSNDNVRTGLREAVIMLTTHIGEEP